MNIPFRNAYEIFGVKQKNNNSECWWWNYLKWNRWIGSWWRNGDSLAGLDRGMLILIGWIVVNWGWVICGFGGVVGWGKMRCGVTVGGLVGDGGMGGEKKTARQRSYQRKRTSSRPITEVKCVRAWIVLGWVTAWEHRVLLSFLSYFFGLRQNFFGTFLCFIIYTWKLLGNLCWKEKKVCRGGKLEGRRGKFEGDASVALSIPFIFIRYTWKFFGNLCWKEKKTRQMHFRGGKLEGRRVRRLEYPRCDFFFRLNNWKLCKNRKNHYTIWKYVGHNFKIFIIHMTF